MKTIIAKNTKTLSILMFVFIVTGCVSLPSALTSGDPKTDTSWTAPAKFSANEVYNAAFKAVSRLDAEIISNDRETGIISVNRSFPVMFSAIPSQVPITIIVSQSGDNVTLKTTAFLKGMGTADVYEDLKSKFHAGLFSELNITNPQEKVVNETAASL